VHRAFVCLHFWLPDSHSCSVESRLDGAWVLVNRVMPNCHIAMLTFVPSGQLATSAGTGSMRIELATVSWLFLVVQLGVVIVHLSGDVVDGGPALVLLLASALATLLVSVRDLSGCVLLDLCHARRGTRH